MTGGKNSPETGVFQLKKRSANYIAGYSLWRGGVGGKREGRYRGGRKLARGESTEKENKENKIKERNDNRKEEELKCWTRSNRGKVSKQLKL